MTDEQKIKILEMRLDGHTLQSIANEMGVTREAIRQTLPSSSRGNYTKAAKACVYPNLAKWMHEQRYTFTDIAYITGLNIKSIHRWLTGVSDVRKRVIDKLLEATGMSYEVLFWRGSDDGD